MGLKFFGVLISGSLLMIGCARQSSFSIEQATNNIKDSVGCQHLKSAVFDSMYTFLDQEKMSPQSSLFAQDLQNKILSISGRSQDKEKLQAIANELTNVLSVMNEEAEQSNQFPTAKDHLRFLIQLEFENSSSASHIKLASKIRKAFQKIETLESDLHLKCQQTESPPGSPTSPEPVPPVPSGPPSTAQQLTPAQFGGQFAFATAYQSCDVLNLPEITANTEDVVGIRLGSDVGGGYARSYASIPDIQRTHYYLRGIQYQTGCISVKNRPLVYDFGGEPAVESKRLNFFANSGIGGSALGLDCSAFVSSALAAGGLRYSPNIANKPIFVRQTSRDFIDPEKSGWKCFERISLTANQTLISGDIMAVEGHVVMVDHVGFDPFGIFWVISKEQCSKVTAKNFDFIVLQSSPSKGSIGINRYAAKDYLMESDSMRTAFESYAKSACLARITGVSNQPKNSKFSLIRHKGTPQCMAPRLELAQQACISSCNSFR